MMSIMSFWSPFEVLVFFSKKLKPRMLQLWYLEYNASALVFGVQRFSFVLEYNALALDGFWTPISKAEALDSNFQS